MSVMCRRPSMPSRSIKAPKSVRFFTCPLTLSPTLTVCRKSWRRSERSALDHLAAAQHDVLPLVVDLDDLELVDVAQKFVEVLGRDDVDLGTGEEGLHPDVHHQATFHHPLDLALHQAAVFKHLDDLVPVLLVGGLFLREDNHALIVLEALQEDFPLRPLPQSHRPRTQRWV